MFLAECQDKVDPDTILLPGASGHNLNTLEEFELDYSQVGRGGLFSLSITFLSPSDLISPGSLNPTKERVKLRVHRGVWHHSPQLPRYQVS